MIDAQTKRGFFRSLLLSADSGLNLLLGSQFRELSVQTVFSADGDWKLWADEQPPSGVLIEAAYRYQVVEIPLMRQSPVVTIKKIGFAEDVPAGADALDLQWRLTGIGREQLEARCSLQ